MRGFKNNGYYKYLTEEDHLQRAVLDDCARRKLPVLHYAAEGKRSRFEQYKAKYLGAVKGVPDIFIPVGNSQYCGLWVELKKEGVTVYNKDGSPRKAVMHQHLVMEMLRKHGFKAEFAAGWDEWNKLITEYLKQ